MNDLIRTAEDYRHYAQKKSNAHYHMTERAKALNNKLGIPVVIATAVVGTSIFATLSSPQQNLWLQISTGLLSLVATVLSALHTFFNYSQVAAQHKEAAAKYEGVRHELDSFILANPYIKDDEQHAAAIGTLRTISKQLDEIAREAPSIPDSVYDSIKTRVAERPILSEDSGPAVNPSSGGSGEGSADGSDTETFSE
jgi:hypothetical protein